MTYFIWSKVQVESGLSLPQILVLKEAERLAGNGVFWWGIGTALNRDAVRRAAEASSGTLPVLFSLMLSRPKSLDAHPEQLYVWRQWEEENRSHHNLPRHVLEFSRAHGKKFHHALVCRSSSPLALASHPFDPTSCQNASGKPIADSQVTALLQGDIEDSKHSSGIYHFGFRATLVDPWIVKLINPRPLGSTEIQLYEAWKREWENFAARCRGEGSQ